MLLWQTCILKIIIVCSIAMTSPEHSTHQQVQVGFPQSHTASNGRPNDPPGNGGGHRNLNVKFCETINQSTSILKNYQRHETYKHSLKSLMKQDIACTCMLLVQHPVTWKPLSDLSSINLRSAAISASFRNNCR